MVVNSVFLVVFLGLLILAVRKGRKKYSVWKQERLERERQLQTGNPFFQRRMYNWIEHPEMDEELTQWVREGRYPELVRYMSKAANE